MSGDTTIGPARRRLTSEPTPGDLVGTYVVLGTLGRGGGGIVLSAHDPALDRRIALKLVRPGDGSSDPGRLLGEAQALARLAHPNVVTVYEVGTFGDQVFIAMEHIEGDHLEAWCAADKRSRGEILSAYVQAGRGLAAAHAAAIVHGDIKPRNAIMGRDGRVRIIDFGLARAVDQTANSNDVAGTPRYMAPEQREGEPATPRSDQYSFCRSLKEALAGRRLPGRLARLLRRGLALDPRERFGSMTELLKTLARDRAQSRRRLVAAVGIAVVTGSGTAFALGGEGRQRPRCPDPTAALDGIWNADRKSTIDAAVKRNGASSEQAARITASLQTYFADWTVMRDEACTAARMDRTQTEMMLELRNQCLDDRLRDARALVDVLEDHAVSVDRAVQAALSLPPLDHCADTDWLLARIKPPEDPRELATVNHVRDSIAQSRALFWAGLYERALAEAKRARKAAAASDYVPIRAEAEVQLGFMHGWTGASEAALRHGQSGVRLALRSGHYAAAARGWNYLIWVLGGQVGDREAAYTIAGYAEALLAGLPETETMRASVLGRRGALKSLDGDHDAAIADLEKSLNIRLRELGERHPDVGYSRSYLASALYARGDHDAALAQARAARALFRDHIAPRHPELIRATILIARCLRARGQPQQAVDELTELVPDLDAALGADPFALGAEVHVVLGAALSDLNRRAQAASHYRAAIAAFERRDGEDSPRVVKLRKKIEIASTGCR